MCCFTQHLLSLKQKWYLGKQDIYQQKIKDINFTYSRTPSVVIFVRKDCKWKVRRLWEQKKQTNSRLYWI